MRETRRRCLGRAGTAGLAFGGLPACGGVKGTAKQAAEAMAKVTGA